MDLPTLENGRIIRISSDSQYEGLFPWNVSIWGSDQAAQADAFYIQLQSSLLVRINALWQGIGEQGSPIWHYLASEWKVLMGDPLPETVQFNISKFAWDFQDGPAIVPIWGSKPGALDDFLPLLARLLSFRGLPRLSAGGILATNCAERKANTLSISQSNPGHDGRAHIATLVSN